MDNAKGPHEAPSPGNASPKHKGPERNDHNMPDAAGRQRQPVVVRHARYDLNERPFIVIWEVTRACDLACKHCRAEAQPLPHPGELSTAEAQALLQQIADFGSPPPLFVMTGGDPFKRPDLFELVRYGASLGLPVSVSPSGTPSLTEANLRRLREAGAVALSLSLDGSTPEVHDGFRQVPGVYDWTLAGWQAARALGFKVQINTTVGPHNLDDLPGILRLVQRFGAMAWSLFFLVPTGRGRHLEAITPQQFEDVLNWLYDVDKVVSLKTTEGHHFRRVVLQRYILESRGIPPDQVMRLGPTYRRLRDAVADLLPPAPPASQPAARQTTGGTVAADGATTAGGAGAAGRTVIPMRRTPLDVNAGRGFVFISHVGTVHPSGFLPIPAGNVRRQPLAAIYRRSPLFQALRDPDRLGGRCGRCEFRTVCGGSRSRAYGATGDPLAEEPWCTYQPGSFPYADAVQELLAG